MMTLFSGHGGGGEGYAFRSSTARRCRARPPSSRGLRSSNGAMIPVIVVLPGAPRSLFHSQEKENRVVCRWCVTDGVGAKQSYFLQGGKGEVFGR